MKADIKKQWVDALRSGEYSQGEGALANVDEDGKVSYCCLGVLCDLAVKAGAIPQSEVTGGQMIGLLFNGEGAVLPQAVVEWAGTDDEYGRDDLGLAVKNDSGVPFATLAEIIEISL